MSVQEPEWVGDWTEEKALDFCRAYITEKESIKICAEVPDVDIEGAIETCAADIKVRLQSYSRE